MRGRSADVGEPGMLGKGHVLGSPACEPEDGCCQRVSAGLTGMVRCCVGPLLCREGSRTYWLLLSGHIHTAVYCTAPL